MKKKSEILDQVDKTGKVIGQAPREDFHSNPKLIHPVAHAWIFNSKGKLLWQKRAETKKVDAGLWDISVAGHISAGDTPEATIKREAQEELDLTNVDFILVTKYIWRKSFETELVYLYYAVTDKKLSEFKIQMNEISKIEWTRPASAFKKIYTGERKSTPHILVQIPAILEYLIKNQK